jgi:aspyridone synthetase trans-acting enoyl reductase
MIPPKQQTSLKITPEGRIAAVRCSLPSLQNDELLVRVRSIALNPFDAKSAEMSPTVGATLGCDFAEESLQDMRRGDADIRVASIHPLTRDCLWPD